MSTNTVVKVLSYNIHKGLGLGNRAFTLPRMRDAMTALQPDIVFLQEVLGQHDKLANRFEGWPTSPQSDFLAEAGWPHAAYGKNAVYTHGHHGNAILSKYPIVEFENIDISTNAFESRGILHAVVAIPGVSLPLHCMCVHLNMLRKGRDAQLKHLCRRVMKSVAEDEPLIVAGDFNDWQESATQQLFDDIGVHEVFLNLLGAHAPTFPSAYPLLRLDRVYARGVRTLGGEILHGPPWDALSDHAPLLAQLEFERG
jgi:endonuclease/exonuclease/phosphatase family metal-dependent hydrolase